MVTAHFVAAIDRWRAERPGVLVVAVDGHGGAGKTTIAGAAARAADAALVHTDDFFTPAGPGAPLDRYYDWRRIRAEALEPLRAGRAVRFARFDWDAGHGFDGQVAVEPAHVILLEGVFAAAPQLADLVDRTVLVDTPAPERLRRLRARIPEDEWDEAWLAAEREYFGRIRPPRSFALIVPGSA
jgi:uridine kinase